MTGYARDELLGRDARLLYPDDEAYDTVGHEKYAPIASHGIGAVETRWRRKDGAVRDILLSSTPVDLSRPFENVVFNALDLTALRESERALAACVDDLARSNEELQRFAYAASHDLQESCNPFSAPASSWSGDTGGRSMPTRTSISPSSSRAAPGYSDWSRTSSPPHRSRQATLPR